MRVCFPFSVFERKLSQSPREEIFSPVFRAHLFLKPYISPQGILIKAWASGRMVRVQCTTYIFSQNEAHFEASIVTAIQKAGQNISSKICLMTWYSNIYLCRIQHEKSLGQKYQCICGNSSQSELYGWGKKGHCCLKGLLKWILLNYSEQVISYNWAQSRK